MSQRMVPKLYSGDAVLLIRTQLQLVLSVAGRAIMWIWTAFSGIDLYTQSLIR